MKPLAATLLAIFFPLAPLAAGDLLPLDNLVENPAFDQDRDRDQNPDGWSANPFQSGARLDWDRSLSRSGKGGSLRIRDPRKSTSKDWKQSAGRWASQRRPVKPGTPYELEAWIKTENVGGRALMRISWQDKSGAWLGEVSSKDVSGTTDWHKVALSAVPPAGAESLTVVFELGYGPGTAWLDDVTLSGLSSPLPQVEYTFNDTDGWFPFTFPNDDTNLDGINLTHLLDAPAGKHGFVTTGDDGHFYYQNGKRARFFGTNLGGRDCAPDKKVSTALAARLAKYGVNMIRLHAFDSSHGGIIDYQGGDSQNLDPRALDRMDFLIAELKKNGIYIYLDLLDYRMFRSADGVKHGDEFTHNWAGSMKGASIFDERMIELQKDYAAKLLSHQNPHTGLRYVDDPAIAVVEVTNENSIFYFLLNKELSHPYYRGQLEERWNAWLRAKYQGRGQLARAWTARERESELLDGEDPMESSVKLPAAEVVRYSKGLAADRNAIRFGERRTRDALEFLGGLQDRYYRQMTEHLRKEVGVRVPLTGTNQTFVLRDTESNARYSDFISRNQYWRHPSVNAKPFFKFSNEPMVRSDLLAERSPITVFASSSVAGKAMALAEFNFPWPNEYRCEGLILGTAYACLQDWDAVLLFSYSIDEPRLGFFRSQSDPARWGEFPAAAQIFHRQDVAAARNEIHVVHTAAATARMQPDERYAPSTNFRYLGFLSKVRRSFIGENSYRGTADAVLASGQSADAKVADEGKTQIIRIAENPWEKNLYPEFVAAAKGKQLPGYEHIDATGKQFDSDTGELSLDYGRGLFTVNTPRSKAAVGYLAQTGKIDLDGFVVDSTTEFAAIILTSLDGKAIGASHHLLLTSVARAENTAQGFWPRPVDPKSWSPFTQWMLPAEGRLPVIAEPVAASLRIPVPGGLKVYPLDESGKRRKAIATGGEAGVLEFDPSTARSIWCEIAR